MARKKNPLRLLTLQHLLLKPLPALLTPLHLLPNQPAPQAKLLLLLLAVPWVMPLRLPALPWATPRLPPTQLPMLLPVPLQALLLMWPALLNQLPAIDFIKRNSVALAWRHAFLSGVSEKPPSGGFFAWCAKHRRTMKKARTTPAVRVEIAASSDTAAVPAERHCVSERRMCARQTGLCHRCWPTCCWTKWTRRWRREATALRAMPIAATSVSGWRKRPKSAQSCTNGCVFA